MLYDDCMIKLYICIITITHMHTHRFYVISVCCVIYKFKHTIPINVWSNSLNCIALQWTSIILMHTQWFVLHEHKTMKYRNTKMKLFAEELKQFHFITFYCSMLWYPFSNTGSFNTNTDLDYCTSDDCEIFHGIIWLNMIQQINCIYTN